MRLAYRPVDVGVGCGGGAERKLGLHLKLLSLETKVMPIKNFTLLVSAMILMSACAQDEKAKPSGVIPEAQLQALEKARSVEEALKQQHEEQRKKLDEE